MYRSIDKWLPGYLRSVLRRPREAKGTKHLMFCVADHFEPFRQKVSKQKAMEIVGRWAEEWPVVAGKYRDADGRAPQHTFFYPLEEYDAECVVMLAGICGQGFGEVEIHLHHRNDTREGFRSSLERFRDTLREKHGLLGSDREGNARYGFIHGNWALCNSRPDGDWCGVNEELGILSQTGCYADFTFPSAPSPTQPRLVNAIYRAVDTPGSPRACDFGMKVKAEKREDACRKSAIRDSLMLVTGPLALDWRRRKWGIFPRLENGAITAVNLPEPEKIDLWINQHICIEGRSDWIFVKVYTHGCRQENADILLGDSMRRAYDHLQSVYNDGREWSLHLVTAREMYNIVRAAEDGKAGNPGLYRDYEILPPSARK